MYIYIYIYALVPGPSTPPMVWSPPSGPHPTTGGRGPFYTHSRHTLYNIMYILYTIFTDSIHLYTSLYTYYILFPLPHNIPPPQGGGGYQDHEGGRGWQVLMHIYIYIYEPGFTGPPLPPPQGILPPLWPVVGAYMCTYIVGFKSRSRSGSKNGHSI